ncbi:TRAP transporter small permease [Rhodobacteraceae bacterium KMM 6894]|nr:TRAP transporter small permease [Rhodobacteraceae bacterium KMM 6894]
MTAIRRVITYSCNILMIIGGTAILMMMLQICMDAGMRTLASSSVPGTLEIVSFYYMVAVVFLPLAYIQLHRGHVIIELFTSGLRPRTVSFIDGLVYSFAAFAMGYFTMAAFNKAVAMTNLGEFVLGVILVFTWPARWFVVVGTGLMSIVYAFSALEEFIKAFGRGSPDETHITSEKGH